MDQSKTDQSKTDTAKIVRPVQAALKYFFKSAIELSFDFGAASHVGLCRSDNQDSYVVAARTRIQEALLTNVPQEMLTLRSDEAYAIAVADGMGGKGRGDLASQLAIRTAWDLAGRTTSWLMRLGDLKVDELTERIEGFSYMMQQAFEDECAINPEFSQSGTTWTLAYLVSSFAIVAQIGDSPCFLLRNGIMSKVMRDHTVEQEFIAAGVSPLIAGKYRNMLTRCFGSHSHDARPDIHHLRLQPGDQLLVCSDGLTDMVPVENIAQCLDESVDAQSACDGLVALALAAGGRDNVTAVLARAESQD